MTPALLRSAQPVELETRDGRRLCGSQWPGSGPPSLLLHGLLASAADWDAVAGATRRPSVALDLPGFGASDLPTRPRISAYADDVVFAIQELDLHDVVLVGHSLGGAIAVAVAERAPDRVASMVLLAPVGFGRVHLAEAATMPVVRALTAALLPLALANRALVTLAYATMVTAGQTPEPELVAQLGRRASVALPGTLAATRAVVAAGLSQRAFHRRPIAFAGDVTAIWGDRDRLVPRAHAEALQRALPQARLQIWAGMGHHPQCERLAELASVIEGSVAQAPSRAVGGVSELAVAPVRRARRVAKAA